MVLRLSLAAILFSAFQFAYSQSLPTRDGITYVFTDESGVTIETRIDVQKEGEKAKIIFWQETDNGFIFKDVSWKGDVVLHLENGETIRLKDTRMKGHYNQPGAYIAGYFVPNHYERYSTYLLSNEQCFLLKKSSIMRVDYTLDSKDDKGLHHLEVNDHDQMLKSQLAAQGM